MAFPSISLHCIYQPPQDCTVQLLYANVSKQIWLNFALWFSASENAVYSWIISTMLFLSRSFCWQLPPFFRHRFEHACVCQSTLAASVCSNWRANTSIYPAYMHSHDSNASLWFDVCVCAADMAPWIWRQIKKNAEFNGMQVRRVWNIRWSSVTLYLFSNRKMLETLNTKLMRVQNHGWGTSA